MKERITIPSSLQEQRNIAEILTRSEDQTRALEAQLAFFKTEKRALMQQLLTGKRRVVVSS